MPIQLVVFDLAGTTVKDNGNVGQFLQAALRREGVEVPLSEIMPLMGIPKPVAIRQLLTMHQAPAVLLTDEAVDRMHRHFLAGMIHYYQTDPEIGEKEGVSDTFRALKAAGIRVALDTGFDRSITNAILERLGWEKAGLVDASVTSDEVANGRPRPDLVYRAMELTGVTDPKAVAKVGDTSSDLLEGHHAGCRLVIGVTTGAFRAEELRTYPHTHLVAQVAEILPIIREQVSALV